MLKNDDAMYCPSCQVLLLKKWGCDWLKCGYCKSEICWVTKQLRWGPKVKESSKFNKNLLFQRFSISILNRIQIVLNLKDLTLSVYTYDQS